MRTFLVFIALSFLHIPLPGQGWKWAAGSSCRHGNAIDGTAITTDKFGNVYEACFAGRLSADTLTSEFGPFIIVDSANTGKQGILVSLDSNGAYRWAIGTQGGQVEFLHVATGPSGNVYVVGQALSGHFTLGAIAYNGAGYFCCKVSPDGNVVWIKNPAPGADAINGICISSTGNLYMAGLFSAPELKIGSTTLKNADQAGISGDVFFARYDSSCNPLWSESFGGTESENLPVIALTNDSELYVSGTFLSSSLVIGRDTLLNSGKSPFYLARFGASGNPIWARANTSNTISSDNCVAADKSGNAYITGVYQHLFTFGHDTLSEPSFYSMFLAKYDATGWEQWARTIPGFIEAYCVAADPTGGAWVSGALMGGHGSDPMFLARYGSSGLLEDTLILRSGGEDNNAITLDDKGSLYVGSDYLVSPFTVGNNVFQLMMGTAEALFVAKYMPGAHKE